MLEVDRPGIGLQSSAAACFVVHQRQLALQCRYVVAFMALVGISTALLANMLGQARIFTMAAREHLIPIFWARVSPRYGTPIAAQITMGAASGQRSHPKLLAGACVGTSRSLLRLDARASNDSSLTDEHGVRSCVAHGPSRL